MSGLLPSWPISCCSGQRTVVVVPAVVALVVTVARVVVVVNGGGGTVAAVVDVGGVEVDAVVAAGVDAAAVAVPSAVVVVAVVVAARGSKHPTRVTVVSYLVSSGFFGSPSSIRTTKATSGIFSFVRYTVIVPSGENSTVITKIGWPVVSRVEKTSIFAVFAVSSRTVTD
jgi:hypothetical protein